MSKKGKLKRAIADCENTIKALEAKRARSQSALMTAMLRKEKPNPQDEEFFCVFSNLIDNEREHLKELIKELKELTGKDEI